MNPIRVSICTSVLNQSDWLKGMITSVIASTLKEWELLIVDDGSTEDIKSVVESFDDKRIRYFVFPENRGIPHGANFTMDIATGEYAQWLAADERISPTKLEEQVKYLDEHPGVDAVWGLPTYAGGQRLLDTSFGPRAEWEQNGLRAHNRSNEQWLRTLLQLENVPLGSCSMLMRRSVLKELGPMDERLIIFSDHELFCRFFAAGKIGVVLPHRWAVDIGERTGETLSVKHAGGWEKEIALVREKHPLPVPAADGTVTVGIPCYNHGKFLPEAIASLMAQTRPVDEILVLDDCSTDDSLQTARKLAEENPKVKVLGFPENMGCQMAKTQMAYRAQGDFFMVLSADDLVEPTFVERVMAKFKENPWLEFVASQTRFVKEDLTPLEPDNMLWRVPQCINRGREEWLGTLYNGNHYFGAGIYRTRMISDVGGWKKEFKVIDDYEMYLKILQRENIGIVEEPLTLTRVHGGNKSLSTLGEGMGEELPWLYHAARKPYYKQQQKVVIATPFYEVKAWSPYIVALMATIRLLNASGIRWDFMELSGDSYVHRARNTLCEWFLRDPEATDLFFIDSDMTWNPEAFLKMIQLPDPIVGGSYPVKNGWDKWTSIPQIHTEDGMNHYRGRDLGDGTALIQAHVLAGGFLRIKREVLEKFKTHYPDLWYLEPSTDPKKPDRRYFEFFAAEKVPEDKMFYGEDHMFSRRMRGMEMPMMIYPNATITHYGINGWTGNLDQWLKDEKKKAETQPAPGAVQ